MLTTYDQIKDIIVSLHGKGKEDYMDKLLYILTYNQIDPLLQLVLDVQSLLCLLTISKPNFKE